MAVIQVLDKSVSELIAAGEVVERPAAIAKELLENAVDAGATSITVEIEQGGISLLRIRDNGIGIEREDVPRAFLRHATSKIHDASDLDSILTLGFRGEALASIAAMCRVELTTKTAAEQEGTTCRVEGGSLLEILPAGCPTGTTITVRDVFFNTPARMKFLKKNTSEGSAVAQVVDKCALSHPEIAFRFIRDGQPRLQTSGNGDLLSVINAIYGRDFASSMIPVSYVHEEAVGVNGYISAPAGVKPSRTYQNFFINGRFVRTRTAAAALEEAFKNKILPGKYPACVLNLELDAATVDVNVHPAKTEVRFAEEKPIFNAVYFGVKSALQKQEQPEAPAATLCDSGATPKQRPLSPLPQPQERMTARDFQIVFGGSTAPAVRSLNTPLPLGISGKVNKVNLDIEVDRPVKAPDFVPGKTDKIPHENPNSRVTIEVDETAPPSQLAFEKEPPYLVIGELSDTYILLQKQDDLVLVDKHAAHERILYEQLKENLAYGNRQLMLASQMVTLSREDYAALLENLDTVEKLGFLVEDFGDGTVIVRETPIELGEKDVAYIIAEIADKLRACHRDLTPQVLDRLYYSIACKGAVRAGDKNSAPELGEIVRLLEVNPHITHCPHGRPVQVKLSRYEIEKLFGRQG